MKINYITYDQMTLEVEGDKALKGWERTLLLKFLRELPRALTKEVLDRQLPAALQGRVKLKVT